VNEPMLLSKRTAARSLSISVRTLDKLLASRTIPALRIGRRVLIALHHLEEFALGSGAADNNLRASSVVGPDRVRQKTTP
jgi:excisionase family DNA binding protein